MSPIGFRTCSSPVCQQNFSGKVQSSVQLSIMVHVPFYVELTIFQLLYFESDRIVYCSDVRTRTSLSIVHTAGTDLREVDQSAVFNRHKKKPKVYGNKIGKVSYNQPVTRSWLFVLRKVSY